MVSARFIWMRSWENLGYHFKPFYDILSTGISDFYIFLPNFMRERYISLHIFLAFSSNPEIISTKMLRVFENEYLKMLVFKDYYGLHYAKTWGSIEILSIISFSDMSLSTSAINRRSKVNCWELYTSWVILFRNKLYNLLL